ncbi:MAG: potassium channel family protein [Aggregatilineales bacterium]
MQIPDQRTSQSQPAQVSESALMSSVRNLMPGKVLRLLGLVVLVQSIYPITADNSVVSVLIYQFLYMTLLIAGGLVSNESPIYTRILGVLGVTWVIVGGIYAFNQEAVWAQLITYLVIIAFQTVVTKVMIQYIFISRVVNREVIYAAVAVYFLLGAIFVPIYGIIETITFHTMDGAHAISDSTVAAGQPIPWQTFIYYSYATLTTVGYGDVLPVTMWARSAASLEAIIGVMYVTIIMARLVGMYASREVDEAFDEFEEREDTKDRQQKS